MPLTNIIESGVVVLSAIEEGPEPSNGLFDNSDKVEYAATPWVWWNSVHPSGLV
jgi:hypothetical protein